jgi:hypothetical protein
MVDFSWIVGGATVFAMTAALGCSARANQAAPGATADSSASAAQSASCQPGATLTGAAYDITKSKFAFGSMPSIESASGLVRWVGRDGVVAIFPGGMELGVMNAGAPESDLSDWSTDSAALSDHVIAYVGSMGVAPCQIAFHPINSTVSGGGSIDGSFVVTSAANTVALVRGVDGILVSESNASARFNSADQTTQEGMYWPPIAASVVRDARAFRDRLADPARLAAYKALLPSDAQGDGQVVIHHSGGGTMSPFQAAATYDVAQSVSGMFGAGQEYSFDPNGNPVTTAW